MVKPREIHDMSFEELPLGLRFRLIHKEFKRLLNEDMQDMDVTYSQMFVMRYLISHDGEKVNQKMLCEAARVRHPTMVGILSRMEEKELVVQRIDPDNRRCRDIALTPKAREILNSDLERREVRDALLVAGFSEEEKKELNYVLSKVYRNLIQDKEEVHAENTDESDQGV